MAKKEAKIKYQADSYLLLQKIKKIILNQLKKQRENSVRGKLIRIEVPFDTRFLVVEKWDRKERVSSIKKVMGIEIKGKCNKLKFILDEGK